MNHNQTASKRLVKNTIIYMVGNIGSKLLQMLILPILTGILLTEEYGYYDLIITTINLVTPIVTLQVVEAMFRFLFNGDEKEKRVIISSVSMVLFLGVIILAIAIYVTTFIGIDLQYPFLIYLNYVTCIVFDYMQKIARSQQKNLSIAISGIINTFVMLSIEALTLLVFHMRVSGMLLANCISYLIAALYLEYVLHIEKFFSTRAVSIKKIRDLLKYSLPLVPNSVCWWIVSACDRYVISFFLSVSSNGIYSIASKFSQLLSMATSVFQMAWQESSIIESDKESRDLFYTNTFNSYIRLLLGGYIVLLPFIRLIIPYLIAKEYQIGYLYNPLLLLGAVFAAFSQFYGSAYLVFKKTSDALSTTIIAAIVNVFVGIRLIKHVGLFAPAFGTTLSFFLQWILRVHQMRDYFKVKLDYKFLTISGIITIIYFALYYQEKKSIHIIMFLIGIILFSIYNIKLINNFIKIVKKRYKKSN